MNEQEKVLCELCEEHEIPPGTTLRCDRCYELESRIQDNPDLAVKVLGALEGRWKVVTGVKTFDIVFTGDEEPGMTVLVPSG